jgi:hypothetical protein
MQLPVMTETQPDTELPQDYRPMGIHSTINPETAVVCKLGGCVVSSEEMNTHSDWHSALYGLLNP